MSAKTYQPELAMPLMASGATLCSSSGVRRLMKVLSIKQPWARLIANCDKDIENRSWPTRFRGEFLIHASKAWDNNELLSFLALMEERNFKPVRRHGDPQAWGDVDCGGIVGIAEIVDCVTESDSNWFCGPYGFVLRNARPLPFFPCSGKLGFWALEYPEELLRKTNVRDDQCHE